MARWRQSQGVLAGGCAARLEYARRTPIRPRQHPAEALLWRRVLCRVLLGLHQPSLNVPPNLRRRHLVEQAVDEDHALLCESRSGSRRVRRQERGADAGVRQQWGFLHQRALLVGHLLHRSGLEGLLSGPSVEEEEGSACARGC
eukprot:scaffold4985_cov116-Isochrysis_galbana.AAC.10